jgi:hypothetical protein
MRLLLNILKNYIVNNTIAVDQLLNVILGGSPDETLSSRAYRTEQQNKILGMIFRPLIDLLFSFDPLHCYESYMSEVHRTQLPINFLLTNELNEQK